MDLAFNSVAEANIKCSIHSKGYDVFLKAIAKKIILCHFTLIVLKKPRLAWINKLKVERMNRLKIEKTDNNCI